MPIYAYQCQACGHDLEAIQKISDARLVDCPACGKPELKKMLTAPSFRLSGSGWYETDFKKANKKNLAGEAATGEGSGSAGTTADKAGEKTGDKSSDKSDDKGNAKSSGKGASAKPAVDAG